MKTFLEVFPDLHIAENVRGLLEMVGIEKISTNRDRSVIRVYIDSPRLMHKQSIYDLEKGIKEQLFPGKRVTIKILEKYHLSSQYTPEKLMNVYRDSILMELKNYSILLYNMFRKAEMDFEEEDIIERFSRGDKARTSEGNGLGLAIVSTYAKALGGEFDIKIDCDQFKAIVSI